jgi:hypothetical protein
LSLPLLGSLIDFRQPDQIIGIVHLAIGTFAVDGTGHRSGNRRVRRRCGCKIRLVRLAIFAIAPVVVTT